MRRRPPRSTLDRSSAASDVYKRQDILHVRSNAAGQQAVVLYDMAGGTMARETVNSAVATIDVRSLPAGMYVLQVGDAKRLIAVQ